MMQNLGVPHVEEIGTTYNVKWDEGVTMKLSALKKHGDYHIDAEIVVWDYQDLNPKLNSPRRVHLMKDFGAFLRHLESVSERPDWLARLSQAADLVLERFRAGAPVVGLGTMEQPEPTREILSGVVWEGMPTLLYGPGGIGKSIVCLNFAAAIHCGYQLAGLTAEQSNVLVLDWETSDRQTWWRNAEILRAHDVDASNMVFYRFMAAPLEADAEYLKQQIAELNIGTVIIDSAGPACGGMPESAEGTLQFFNALRGLSQHDKPLQSIIIAHVTHASRQGLQKSSPFGSVYWGNIPRNTFELTSVQYRNSNYSEYALHHRKSNLGPLRDPLAFRMTWHEGCQMESINLTDNSRLVATMDLDDRIGILLAQRGQLSTDEIAERLQSTARVIGGILETDDRYIEENGLWKSSERNW